MVNARILELVNFPENIVEADLPLLQSEIAKHPFVQSFRALALVGAHKFRPADYAAELSKTAAYTTDKKILYRLINKNTEPIVEKIPEEKPTEIPVLNNFDIESHPETKTSEKPKPVMVNGELNRILFEGEEDFMEKETPKIDLATTMEAGKLVLEQPEISDSKQPQETETMNFSINKINDESFDFVKEKTDSDIDFNLNKENTTENILEDKKFPEVEEGGTPEKIIHEEKMDAEVEIIENPTQLSFHSTDNFLPEVKFQPAENQNLKEAPKAEPNRHEAEMQRLIAEVEAKMKDAKSARKQSTEVQEELAGNTEINFAETMDFEVKSNDSQKAPENISEEKTEKPEPKTEEPEKKSAWQPMSFSAGTPDALIGKIVENQENEREKETPADDRPVLNVSFFAQEVQEIKSEETIAEKPVEPEESNVPKFINTWQSWLKLDKKTEEPKAETKAKVIEKFIENEPKISRLNEDSNFVVKERNDDISHLMTETLANLYLEQKLFTKATKAFEALKQKHPEKADYFTERIKEIQKLRQGK